MTRRDAGDGSASLRAAIAQATGRRPARLAPLSGGCVADVLKVELEDGATVVAKVAPDGGLTLEGFMLDYLRAHTALPVPAVVHCAEHLLLLEYIETAGGLTEPAEAHAAELLAALHGVSAAGFGFERDTAIGSLPQPNPWTATWREFFRDRRLLFMGRLALERGALPGATFARLESLCGRLQRFIDEPAAPALIHGDMWAGNVLARDGRIAAFVDPAIYYADPEIELAFATLFATFGEAFFARYSQIRPIAPGFFEARRDIYNLYPLLVHTALFGAPYAGAVARILDRYA